MVADPRAAEESAGVVEAGTIAVGTVDAPAEHVPVERRRSPGVRGRDVQIGDRARSGEPGVDAVPVAGCRPLVGLLAHDALRFRFDTDVVDRDGRERVLVANGADSPAKRSLWTLSMNHASNRSGVQPRSRVRAMNPWGSISSQIVSIACSRVISPRSEVRLISSSTSHAAVSAR